MYAKTSYRFAFLVYPLFDVMLTCCQLRILIAEYAIFHTGIYGETGKWGCFNISSAAETGKLWYCWFVMIFVNNF